MEDLKTIGNTLKGRFEKLSVKKGSDKKRMFLIGKFRVKLNEARLKDGFNPLQFPVVAHWLKAFDDWGLQILWGNCSEGLDFESKEALGIFSVRWWTAVKKNPPPKKPRTKSMFSIRPNK